MDRLLRVHIDGVNAELSGELDATGVEQLEQAFEVVRSGPIDVDASDLTFLDSAGLRTLLGLARRIPGFRLVNPSQPVQRIIDITGASRCLFGDPARDE